jgi:hypothetical protein
MPEPVLYRTEPTQSGFDLSGAGMNIWTQMPAFVSLMLISSMSVSIWQAGIREEASIYINNIKKP